MDFAALPPEVNSGRMYAGPGSASLLTAATAWDKLATELHAAAANYGSVVSGLTSGQWLGPASAAMASAAAPYATWLSATAGQAAQTGAQARAAAAAHASAYTMTVPPPVIAANRAQLATLVATNIFGQNTPAIAANEAHYAEMWAQDATAMHGYAAAAQTASQMTPFTQPQQTTNPNGLAAQNAAANQAAGTSAGHAAASQAMSAASQAAAPAPPTPPTPPVDLLSSLGSFSDIFALPQDALFDSAIIGAFVPEYLIAGAALPSPLGVGAAAPAAVAAAQPLGLTPITDFNGLTEETLSGGAGVAPLVPALAGSSVSAGVGGASSVSALSVPQAWATAAPELRLAAAEVAAPSFVPAAGAGSMFGNTPLVGGAPLMALPGRGTSSSRQDPSSEEAKRKAAKGRRSTMW